VDTHLEVKIKNTVVELLQGDISSQDTDAVVDAATKNLTPGSGVAGAIHSVAGHDLYEASQKLAPVETGQAVITPAFDLPNTHVIHTVGPYYSGGGPAEAALLERCYTNSLDLAEGNALTSIAFPSISTGIFGYPKKDAAEVAFTTIKKYLRKDTTLHNIRMVVFDLSSFVIHKKAFKKIFGLK